MLSAYCAPDGVLSPLHVSKSLESLNNPIKVNTNTIPVLQMKNLKN